MSASPLEKLEALIPTLLDETRRLREENVQLIEEVEHLRAQLDEQTTLQSQREKEWDRLKLLEREQKKQAAEREELRIRVQGLLVELENTDFL